MTDPIHIPLMGDKGLPVTTTPQQLASWIAHDDKVPILLALSLYKVPRPFLDGFIFQSETHIPKRSGAWINAEGLCVIGFAGTDPFDPNDRNDDKVSFY